MRLAYKPLGMLVSVLGGVVASALFKRLWLLFSNEDEVPSATQQRRSWGEVLVAAAVQGAVFGLVKATLDRGGAVAFQRATGEWPGDE